MLNIEQELEATGWGSDLEVRSPTLETVNSPDDVIRVQLYLDGAPYTNAAFWRKTGVYVGQQGLDNPKRLRPKSATKPVSHFYILAGMKEWEKDQWVRLTSEDHDNGKSASERAKHHNGLSSTSLSPFRFMVKKEIELSPVRDFPAWAEFRFASEEWVKVPWADEEWAIKDHYAHLSLADDCMVAFWPDETAAQMDQVEVISPGKYLQRYYSNVLSPTQIRDWAVKVDVECELHVTMDEDEMVRIYTESGIDSCMRYPDKNWDYTGFIHPIRAYAGGDLGIAYLTRRKKVVARALVWPEKKVAGRCYGDIERMTAMLEAEGYTLDAKTHNVDSHGDGGFEGARLKVIRPIGKYPRNLVLPYLDYKYYANYTFDGTDEKLILTMRGDHNIGGRQTCGLAWEPGAEPYSVRQPDNLPEPLAVQEYDTNCDNCGCGCDDDDLCSLGGDYLCEDCYLDVTFVCASCECRESNDERRIVDGRSWCESCYDSDAFSCEYCSESVSTCNSVLSARDHSHYRDVCDECLETNSQIVIDHTGRSVDIRTTTQCDECSEYYSDEAEECPSCAANQEEEREAA